MSGLPRGAVRGTISSDHPIKKITGPEMSQLILRCRETLVRKPAFILNLVLCAWGAIGAVQAHSQHTTAPDFGPNVLLFKPGDAAGKIQEQIDKIYAAQQHSEFG